MGIIKDSFAAVQTKAVQIDKSVDEEKTTPPKTVEPTTTAQKDMASMFGTYHCRAKQLEEVVVDFGSAFQSPIRQEFSTSSLMSPQTEVPPSSPPHTEVEEEIRQVEIVVEKITADTPIVPEMMKMPPPQPIEMEATKIPPPESTEQITENQPPVSQRQPSSVRTETQAKGSDLSEKSIVRLIKEDFFALEKQLTEYTKTASLLRNMVRDEIVNAHANEVEQRILWNKAIDQVEGLMNQLSDEYEASIEKDDLINSLMVALLQANADNRENDRWIKLLRAENAAVVNRHVSIHSADAKAIFFQNCLIGEIINVYHNTALSRSKSEEARIQSQAEIGTYQVSKNAVPTLERRVNKTLDDLEKKCPTTRVSQSYEERILQMQKDKTSELAEVEGCYKMAIDLIKEKAKYSAFQVGEQSGQFKKALEYLKTLVDVSEDEIDPALLEKAKATTMYLLSV